MAYVAFYQREEQSFSRSRASGAVTAEHLHLVLYMSQYNGARMLGGDFNSSSIRLMSGCSMIRTRGDALSIALARSGLGHALRAYASAFRYAVETVDKDLMPTAMRACSMT